MWPCHFLFKEGSLTCLMFWHFSHVAEPSSLSEVLNLSSCHVFSVLVIPDPHSLHLRFSQNKQHAPVISVHSLSTAFGSSRHRTLFSLCQIWFLTGCHPKLDPQNQIWGFVPPWCRRPTELQIRVSDRDVSSTHCFHYHATATGCAG